MSEAALARPVGVHTLLVPLDGSDASASILPHAAWLAQLFDADMELLRVVPPPSIGDALDGGSARNHGGLGIDSISAYVKGTLEQVAAGLRAQGLRVTSSIEVDGSPARTTILRHAATSKQIRPMENCVSRSSSRQIFCEILMSARLTAFP